MSSPLHLAVALEGESFTSSYWLDSVREAESGLLDFVTFEDSFSPRPHPDAVLVAARVAPLTHSIGLIPTVIATHTEPFHVSKAIATLDYVSSGRAGVRIRVSRQPSEYALFGRRPALSPPAALEEAADYVEVLRRLWDSWEDDAEIRDAATGRFVDRDKLHYIDFAGDYFSVRGPSITPRPPQGQPVVAALGHGPPVYRFIERSADIGFVTPRSRDEVASIVAELPSALVFADIAVFHGGADSDAFVFSGSVTELADLMLDWNQAGLAGFRLRPGPGDLVTITRDLVPELQRRGAFRDRYEAGTLRGLLGLPRPASRYVSEVPS